MTGGVFLRGHSYPILPMREGFPAFFRPISKPVANDADKQVALGGHLVVEFDNEEGRTNRHNPQILLVQPGARL